MGVTFWPGGAATFTRFINTGLLLIVHWLGVVGRASALARRPGASRQTGGLPAQHVGQVAGLSPVLRFSSGASGWRRSRTRPKREFAGDLSEERHGRGGEREDRGGVGGAAACTQSCVCLY